MACLEGVVQHFVQIPPGQKRPVHGVCNSAGCRAPFLPHKMLYSLEYIFPLEICLLFAPMDLKWGFSGNLGLPGGWPYSWLSNHLFCGYKYLSMLSLCDFFL